MSFFTMASEVNGMIPSCPFDYAKTIVNRSFQDVCRQSLWSFNLFESNWQSPAAVSAGTAHVTQGSSAIVFDPLVATPAIIAIGFFPSTVTARQFRIGIGTIYNIWTLTGTQAGTVDTSGTAVTFASGTNFPTDGSVNGALIAINGVIYTISSVADGSNLTLMTSAGTQSGVSFQIAAILTMDRPMQEVSGAYSGSVNTGGWQIYQCYYPSPYPDFKAWESIRDIVNYNDLILSRNREWVNEQDPQRSIFYIPTHVIPYITNQNPASSTYGYMLWELWGQPTFVLTYQLYGTRKGMPLVNPTDTIPQQIGEDVVMAKARYYAYEWAEANRESNKRGGNFLMLKRETLAEYNKLYKEYRRQDRAAVDNFKTRCRIASGMGPSLGGDPFYSSIAGVAYPGSPWGA